MMKRILAALLAATAILTFSACRNDGVGSQNDKENSSTEIEQPVNSENPDITETGDIDYESDLSTERYDGYKFRILTRIARLDTQVPQEDSDDVVTSAVYKRNKVVEEKYGIKIVGTESSNNNYETDALNSILAGDDAYDLVFSHSRAAVVYAVQGAAYNLLEIESLNLEKPWWTRDVIDSFTLNDRLYVLDGDITTNLGGAMCLLFNKKLFDELGFDYPYQAVKNGDWTFDRFAYYAKKGGKDLNGDGVLKAKEDQFGFYSRHWAAPINILYTGGQRIYGKNDEGDLEISLYSNKTVDIFDEFFNLMDNEACYLHAGEGATANEEDGNSFAEGRALMVAESIGAAATLRNMDDDFGIVPYPKFGDDDEYANVVNGFYPLLIIPVTVSDVERTGAITEALCAYGSKYVLPAFYDVSLKTKHSRDEESAEMMDLIKDSIIYDIGYTAGGTFQSVGKDLTCSTNRDFASYYAANESAAKAKLAEFNRDYAGIGK